jgi:hypothetical protein
MIIQIGCLNCKKEFSVLVGENYPHRNPTFTSCGECGKIIPLCGEDLEDYL